MLLESPAGPLTLVTEYMKVNPTTKCMIHATKKFHVQSFVTRDNTIRCALIHKVLRCIHAYLCHSLFLSSRKNGLPFWIVYSLFFTYVGKFFFCRNDVWFYRWFIFRVHHKRFTGLCTLRDAILFGVGIINFGPIFVSLKITYLEKGIQLFLCQQ